MELSPGILGGGLFVLLAITIFFGIPIAFSLGFVSLIYGLIFFPNAFFLFAVTPFGKSYSWILSCLPLFIFMGELLCAARAADDAYDAASKWLGGLPGSLAAASQIAVTIFSAISGAAAASIATVGSIAVPQMLNRGYDKRLALGCICSGATVDVLIPPSIIMVMFGVMAEVSIGGLFMGGMIPGILLTIMFIIYIAIRCYLNPGLAPPIGSATWKERFACLPGTLPLIAFGVFLIGSLYIGLCSPTEVAGIGVLVSLGYLIAYRRFSWKVLEEATLRTVRVSTFIMWILFSAAIFSQLLTHTGGPQSLCSAVSGWEINRYLVILMINIVLLFLGCFIDPAGIIMITVPIFLPIITVLGFDPLWFGVMFVINMQVALITPPLGLNLFVTKSIVPKERTDITLSDIQYGSIPYIFIVVVFIAIIILFPQIVTWLPSTMIHRPLP